jgi:hypothetical protein
MHRGGRVGLEHLADPLALRVDHREPRAARMFEPIAGEAAQLQLNGTEMDHPGWFTKIPYSRAPSPATNPQPCTVWFLSTCHARRQRAPSQRTVAFPLAQV